VIPSRWHPFRLVVREGPLMRARGDATGIHGMRHTLGWPGCGGALPPSCRPTLLRREHSRPRARRAKAPSSGSPGRGPLLARQPDLVTGSGACCRSWRGTHRPRGCLPG
jgi:hypothetical protein